MGNQCCTLAEDQPIIIKTQIPKRSIYVSAQWPQNDYFLQNAFKSRHETNIDHSKLMPYKKNNQNIYYAGQWKDDLPFGEGILYKPSQFLYQGNFQNGQPQGKGSLDEIKNNLKYQGYFVHGKACGQGILSSSVNNYKIYGKWDDSKLKTGKLIIQGSGIEVQLLDLSKRQVLITYPDKRTYQGQIDLKTLLPEGKGIVKYPDSNWFIGNWKNGKMHGDGAFIWEDKGQKYDGDYFEGKKHGVGKFKFSSGNIYQGQWKDGKMDGSGILYNSHKQILQQGIWKNGEYVGTTQGQSQNPYHY